MCLRACRVAAYEPLPPSLPTDAAAAPGEWRPEAAAASRALARRYYLVEKLKDARIVGIVVGEIRASPPGLAFGTYSRRPPRFSYPDSPRCAFAFFFFFFPIFFHQGTLGARGYLAVLQRLQVCLYRSTLFF